MGMDGPFENARTWWEAMGLAPKTLDQIATIWAAAQITRSDVKLSSQLEDYAVTTFLNTFQRALGIGITENDPERLHDILVRIESLTDEPGAFAMTHHWLQGQARCLLALQGLDPEEVLSALRRLMRIDFVLNLLEDLAVASPR